MFILQTQKREHSLILLGKYRLQCKMKIKAIAPPEGVLNGNTCTPSVNTETQVCVSPMDYLYLNYTHVHLLITCLHTCTRVSPVGLICIPLCPVCSQVCLTFTVQCLTCTQRDHTCVSKI